MDHLESVPVANADAETLDGFSMPVQWVNRPDQHFRGFAGMISQGVVRPGDAVRILPSGKPLRWTELSVLTVIAKRPVPGNRSP